MLVVLTVSFISQVDVPLNLTDFFFFCNIRKSAVCERLLAHVEESSLLEVEFSFFKIFET